MLMDIAWVISAVTRAQGREVDRLRLHDAVTQCEPALIALDAAATPVEGAETAPTVPVALWQDALRQVATAAGIDAIEVQEQPDPARMPAVTFIPGAGWGSCGA